jgi:hypothetical protein
MDCRTKMKEVDFSQADRKVTDRIGPLRVERGV